jgi:hypothetical protein
MDNERTKKQKLHRLIDSLNEKQIDKLIQLIRGILGKVI